jgi:hypothetical protein
MGKRGVLLTAGPLLVILGGLPLLYLSIPLPPDLEGWDYWHSRFSTMFDAGGALFVLSATLVAFGCGLFVWESACWSATVSVQRETTTAVLISTHASSLLQLVPVPTD